MEEGLNQGHFFGLQLPEAVDQVLGGLGRAANGLGLPLGVELVVGEPVIMDVKSWRCLEKWTAYGARNWEGGQARGILRWNRHPTQGRGRGKRISRVTI